jgi:hypothetical protein
LRPGFALLLIKVTLDHQKQEKARPRRTQTTRPHKEGKIPHVHQLFGCIGHKGFG